MIKLSALGDVIHTIPSLAALRSAFPHAHITWVVEEDASDLILNHPACDRVLVSYRKRWVRNLKKRDSIGRTIGEIRSFLSTLRDRSYDVAIDFHGLFKSALIMGLVRAERKIGYRSLQELSGIFYGEKIPEDMEKHAVDRYLDFIRYLGFSGQETVFTLALTDRERQRARFILHRNGILEGESFVAVNVVALWETKLWDDEKFAALADRIVLELRKKVVFTGGKDRMPIDKILSRMTYQAVNVAGSTTLRELACLYEQADVVVSTDSGPMHLSAAVGTPTVALFGPTDPLRTGPYGKGHVIVRAGLPCSPCFLKSCETRNCMKSITVEAVFEAVAHLLNGESGMQRRRDSDGYVAL